MTESSLPGESVIKLVVVKESDIAKAQAFVDACESCCSRATIPFDYLLDAITGCDPTVVEYVMSSGPQCPFCSREIQRKTLVTTA